MDGTIPKWLGELSEADYQFIKRFLLASGSLKELASQYGISYPTVRGRLDRLIEKIRILDDQKPQTEFHKTVKLLALEGKIDVSAAGIILRAYEESLEK